MHFPEVGLAYPNWQPV